MNHRRSPIRVPLPSGPIRVGLPAAVGGVALVGAVLVALVAPRLRSPAERLAEGRLAPYGEGWLAPPESLAIRPSAEVGLPSAVEALTRAGEAFYWLDPVGGAVFKAEGTTGVSERVWAAREHEPGVRLRRPVGLAVAAGQVWVLDAAARAVLLFGLDLEPAGRLDLAGVPGLWSSPVALGVDARGRAYVLSRDVEGGTGEARWVLRRFVGGQTERLWESAAPSVASGLAGLFDVPALAVREDGGVLVAHAETYRVLALGPAGETLWQGARRDAPRFALSSEERRAYRRTVERLPGALRRRMPAVRSWPPVAWIEAWGRGWIAAIRAGERAWHVELVAADGAPVARLTGEPLTPPPTFTSGLLVQALAGEDEWVLRWRRLRPGPR